MKICLITGGSRGIGKETVTCFAHNGYTVIFCYNTNKQKAEDLAQELNNNGCDVHTVKCDVANCVEVQNMFDYIKRYFKHIDVLVNNAGVSKTKMLQDITESDFDCTMDTNAKGTFFCCQKAVELGAKSVVNVSSIWGVKGASCESVYAMSKFAVVGLTLSLAKELDGKTKVNCICPPVVLTDMCSNLSEKDIAEFCKEHGTKIYQPSEIAEKIFALAESEENGSVVEL